MRALLAELVEAGPDPAVHGGSALAAGRSARRIAAALRCRAPRAFGREASSQARLPQTVGKAGLKADPRLSPWQHVPDEFARDDFVRYRGRSFLKVFRVPLQTRWSNCCAHRSR